MVSIAIIIPVHNRKGFTQAILAQIEEQLQANASGDSSGNDRPAILTIVVDDGSTDGTRELIAEQFPVVHVLQGDGSLWWTGAIAKGMDYALNTLKVDYVVWMNDDISLADNFIASLRQHCQSGEYQSVVVGGIVRDKTHPDWVIYSGLSQGKPIRDIHAYDASPEIEANTLSGNIVVIPKAVVEKTGLPDVSKFPHHGGDFEYIRMIKRKGFKAISSSHLQAYTDYKHTDLIRYMPYWMQWYLQPNRAGRQAIVKGLRSIKSNQNIWLFVNIRNRDRPHVPAWNYELCYLDKRLKLFLMHFVPKRFLEAKIADYLKSWNAPAAIAELTLNNRGNNRDSNPTEEQRLK